MEPNLARSVGKDLTATCGRPAIAAEHAMRMHSGAALLCWQTLADLFSGLSILVRDRRGQGQETRSSGGFAIPIPSQQSSQPQAPSRSCELDDAAVEAAITAATSIFGPYASNPAFSPGPGRRLEETWMRSYRRAAMT